MYWHQLKHNVRLFLLPLGILIFHFFSPNNISYFSKISQVPLSLILNFKALYFFAILASIIYTFRKSITSLLTSITLFQIGLGLFAFFMLIFLCGPKELYEMGVKYGELSTHGMWIEGQPWERRTLVPGIAFLMKLRGQYYILYHLFSTLILGILIAHILELNTNRWKEIILYFSLLTSGFYAFQFGFPGYIDSSLLILCLLFYFHTKSVSAKLVILTLSLICHELSIFIIFPYILFSARKEIGVLAIPLVIYLMFFWFNKTSSVNTIVYGNEIKNSELFIFLKHSTLFHTFLGVFFSFKLLWPVALIPIFKRPFQFTPITRTLIATLILTAGLVLLVNDITRIMSLLLPILLMTLKELKEPLLKRPYWLAIIIANLFIPHFNVVLSNPNLKSAYQCCGFF